MEFDVIINEALKRIKPSTVFQMANQARPNADYVLNRYLPERTDTSFEVSSASMTVRSTMAGLVAMDAPYPKGGAIAMSDFLEKIAKFAIEMDFSEAGQRKLMEISEKMLARGKSPIKVVIENLLNFTDKMLVQPHLDTMEWLRAKALLNGQLDWEFNGQHLQVDYGFPAGAFLANRTGNDAYGGTSSKFWADIRAMKKYLKYDVDTFLMHPDTLDVIISNPDNNLEIIGESANSFTVVRILEGANGGEKRSTDKRDAVTLTSYGLEAEVLDIANPGKTKSIKFIPPGKILGIGRNNSRTFALTTGVGLGGNPTDLDAKKALGYTHIGPTIEGGGRPGRWARLFVPEARPYALVGQSVMNALPVVENVNKVIVASTAIS